MHLEIENRYKFGNKHIVVQPSIAPEARAKHRSYPGQADQDVSNPDHFHARAL